MRRFEFRALRFPVSMPVRIRSGASEDFGRCIDISEGGMRVQGASATRLGSCGSVIIVHPDWTLELGMQVVYRGLSHAGIRFTFSSDAERRRLSDLLARLDENLL